MDWLRKKRVAATGHLASMSHSELARAIESGGGFFTSSVNNRTHLLVVGSWPLQSDGRLTQKLRKAKELQRKDIAIKISGEAEFLSLLGREHEPDGGGRLQNLAELTRTLQVPRDRVRHWLNAGWIKPVVEKQGVRYFDFQQAIGVKTLWELTQAGVSSKRIRRSLDQIKSWMPLDNPLSQLALIQEKGQLYVQFDGRLADPSGQMYLDFEEHAEALPLPAPQSPEQWFHQGRQHELSEHWRLAAAAYRQSLLLGEPNPSTVFNLANVLYAWGKNEAAAERYYQAIEMKPDYAKAWNNLGGALTELQDLEGAVTAYEKAIALDYADSHYNLANVYEQLGRLDQARRHWQAYARHDSDSEWGNLAAQFARQRRNS